MDIPEKCYISTSYFCTVKKFYLLLLFLFCLKASSRAQENPVIAPGDSLFDLSCFAEKYGLNNDSLFNPFLYQAVQDWLGTCYRYGGRSKEGIDCSDFTSVLYEKVYNINLTGSAGDMYKKCSPLTRSELQEGDLVFFKIRKHFISHVGVYLANNKFAHASSGAGVIISDLNDPYYSRYFYKGGFIANKTTDSCSKPIIPVPTIKEIYSKQLGFTIDSIYNPKLFQSLISLKNKKFGLVKGKKRHGQKIDDGTRLCKTIYLHAFHKKISASAIELSSQVTKVPVKNLKEGDIVFFKRGKKKISVGIYLTNNKFVHVSPKRGIVTADLNEPAYKKTFYLAGRLP